MKNRSRVYSAKFFLISLFVALSSLTIAPRVHALPLTGTFEVTFSQVTPTAVPNAGHGTFTALQSGPSIAVVTAYEFEFTAPLPEEFVGPPLGLLWNGTSLIGGDEAEYISNGFLFFLGANQYEISIPQGVYFDNYLGSICQADGIAGNCLSGVGTYTITQVSEPLSSSLLLFGLGGLGMWRRLRTKQD